MTLWHVFFLVAANSILIWFPFHLKVSATLNCEYLTKDT